MKLRDLMLSGRFRYCNQQISSIKTLKVLQLQHRQRAELFYFYFSLLLLVLQVFIPNNVYKGQNPANEVTRNTIPNVKRMYENIPLIMFVINNITIARKIKTLKVLSKIPMFFFIFFLNFMMQN